MSENKVKWHPYPDDKPKIEGFYLVTVEFPFIGEYKEPVSREIRVGYWALGRFFARLGDADCRITAWAEAPEPYIPEMKNEGLSRD